MICEDCAYQGSLDVILQTILSRECAKQSHVSECFQAGLGSSCKQSGKHAVAEKAAVTIEVGLKERELVEALEPLRYEPLIMFSDMRQAFGGFTNPKDIKRCALFAMHKAGETMQD